MSQLACGERPLMKNVSDLKPRAWILTLLVSALTAGVVWALSPLISGRAEPWDATNHYYPIALAVAGALSGALTSRVRWAYFLGCIVGQLLFEVIFLKTGPLVVVGVIFMALYGVVFVAAALLASYLRGRIAANGRSPAAKDC